MLVCVVAVVWLWLCLQVGTGLGAEGAKALAPELGKLTQLQALDLRGDWTVLVVAVLVLRGPYVSVVVVLRDVWICATTCLCCLHVHRRNVAH